MADETNAIAEALKEAEAAKAAQAGPGTPQRLRPLTQVLVALKRQMLRRTPGRQSKRRQIKKSRQLNPRSTSTAARMRLASGRMRLPVYGLSLVAARLRSTAGMSRPISPVPCCA